MAFVANKEKQITYGAKGVKAMEKNKFKMLFSALLAAVMLTACGGNESSIKKDAASKSDDEPLQVVTTFSILYDIVGEVGGDRVDIHSMVPIGTDPHEYEPLPEDIKKASDADVLFYNGLNLEGGESGWFHKLVKSVGQDESNVYELMEGVEPKYLTAENGTEHEVNPHAFLDPNVGIKMVENARDALIEVDSEHKDLYEENAENYLAQLEEMDKEYKDKIGEIPEENRVLVTSEKAYQYMAERYGLKEGYIWEIDTDEQGTPSQIKSLVNFINENKVPALFVESNVDPRPMETVSKETGIEIAAKLFSDELGKPGEEGDTYLKFLKYNIDKISEGLSK